MKQFHEIDMTDYGVGKKEALELKYFCLSYPEKQAKLLKLAKDTSEEGKAEYKRLEKDIKAIHTAVTIAVEGQPGLLEPLLRNLTRNESIQKMPCGVNQAYQYRKRAFLILKKIK